MSMFQITFIITIISFEFLHIHSANDQFSIVMPQTVTALTGSCVQIPCTFNIPNLKDQHIMKKSFYGFWLKKTQFGNNDSFIVFNSSNNIIRGFSDIQMTGNLTERNCTTVFYNIMMNHSDQYYFRLETDSNVFNTNQADLSDSAETVRITVTDSPKHPELLPKNLSYVMEGSTVKLSCSAELTCPQQPPIISWSHISESANVTTQLLENLDKTQSVFSHMTFNASYSDHRNNISCTVRYPRKKSEDSTVETTVTLLVLFSPKETHIIITSSASTVSVGTNVTLTCKSKGSPSNTMTYTWYKRGQERPIAQGKHFTFIVTQNNTGWYSCTAQNKHGNQSAEIQLTVKEQDGSPIVYVIAVGGIVVVILSALCFYTRYRKMTKKKGDGEKDSRNQAQDGIIDANSTFVLTDNTVSGRGVSETDHNTEEFSTKEDNNEKGSDVIYTQVHTIHIKTEALGNEQEVIYSQVKI